jgi:hypothetical protein
VKRLSRQTYLSPFINSTDCVNATKDDVKKEVSNKMTCDNVESGRTELRDKPKHAAASVAVAAESVDAPAG